MASNNWQKGYKEVKNVIHNEMGITKEEILSIFSEIAKREVQKIVTENRTFIYEVIKEIIREEMANAIKDHKYPKVGINIWDYSNENAFKDYVVGVIKEEIVNMLRKQFEVELDIKKKE